VIISRVRNLQILGIIAPIINLDLLARNRFFKAKTRPLEPDPNWHLILHAPPSSPNPLDAHALASGSSPRPAAGCWVDEEEQCVTLHGDRASTPVPELGSNRRTQPCEIASPSLAGHSQRMSTCRKPLAECQPVLSIVIARVLAAPGAFRARETNHLIGIGPNVSVLAAKARVNIMVEPRTTRAV
jgi:hypothetical protein